MRNRAAHASTGSSAAAASGAEQRRDAGGAILRAAGRTACAPAALQPERHVGRGQGQAADRGFRVLAPRCAGCLRNFRRAGVAKNRSAHHDAGAGATGRRRRAGDDDRPRRGSCCALSAPAGREVIASRAAAPIEGNASPRKPSVAMRIRSSSASFEVACRCTASASSSAVHAACRLGRPRCGRCRRRRAPTAMRARIRHRARSPSAPSRRRRPLDHLAGGDAVDQTLRQQADARRRGDHGIERREAHRCHGPRYCAVRTGC